MVEVPRSVLSRRTFLMSAAAASAAISCRKKPSGFNGYCFVANRDDRSIAVVDLQRFRRLRAIPLPAAPTQVLTLPVLPTPVPASAKLFVLAADTGSIFEIDAGALALSGRADVGGHAVSMALTPTNDSLWALFREPNELVEIPLGSLKPRQRIKLPGPCETFDLSVLGQAAIASAGGGSIYLASLKTGVVERTIAAKDAPSLVCFQRDGRQIIAGSYAGRNLAIFDAATGQTVVRLPIAVAPRNFCTNSDGGQIYVTGDGMDAVAILYPYQTEVAETILAGHAPGPMAEAQGMLLVANPEDARVTALDVNTLGKKLVTVVDVGQQPRRLFTTPDQKWAFALNQQSGDMAVMLVDSLTIRRPHLEPAPVFTIVAVGASPVDAAIISKG